MRLKVKVKKVGNKFEQLSRGIKDLNNESVQVGHFDEQGKHYSGLTYPELMAVHNNPVAHGLDWPPRPVLDILAHKNRKLDSPQIKRILKKYSRLEPSEINNAMLLDEIGQFLREEEKKIFGSGELAPNSPVTVAQKGSNNPLIDTGDLRNKTAYRTSKDKTIKEG